MHDLLIYFLYWNVSTTSTLIHDWSGVNVHIKGLGTVYDFRLPFCPAGPMRMRAALLWCSFQLHLYLTAPGECDQRQVGLMEKLQASNNTMIETLDPNNIIIYINTIVKLCVVSYTIHLLLICYTLTISRHFSWLRNIRNLLQVTQLILQYSQFAY